MKEKRRQHIIAQMISYMEKPAKSDPEAGVKALNLKKDPAELLDLINILLNHRAEVEHLTKWARLNKKAFTEMTPDDIKEVREHFKAKS